MDRAGSTGQTLVCMPPPKSARSRSPHSSAEVGLQKPGTGDSGERRGKAAADRRPDSGDKGRKRGLLLDPVKLRRALDLRFPGIRTRKDQAREIARTGLVSERWMLRAMERKYPSKVEVRAARDLAGILGCSVDAILDADALVSEAALREMNPYGGMEPLTIADRAYGRHTETATLIRWVREAILYGSERLIEVTGPPGTGKSSLMISGALREMQLSRESPALTLLLSPDDFLPDPASKCLEALQAKVEQLRARTEAQASERNAKHTFVVRGGHADIQSFTEDLAGIAVQRRPLVVGVDDADLFASESKWAPVHEFLNTLLDATPHCCIVATSRVHPEPLGANLDWFRQSKRVFRLGHPTPEFLYALIEEPFAEAGLRLPPEQVQRLIDKTLDKGNFPVLQGDDARGDSASPLPLLSLTLARLFEKKLRAAERADRLRESYRESRADGSINASDQAEDPAEHVDSISEADLDVSNIIETLAEQAWQQWAAKQEHLDNDELTSLLCALIYLPPPDADKAPHWNPERPGENLNLLQLGTAPSPRFPRFGEFVGHLQKAGLIQIRNGGYRLAHRAILFYWPRLIEWLANPHGDDDLLEQHPSHPTTGWELLLQLGRMRSDQFHVDSLDPLVAATILAIFIPWADRFTAGSGTLPPFWLRDPIDNAMEKLGDSICLGDLVPGVAKGTRVIHVASCYGMARTLRRSLDSLVRTGGEDAVAEFVHARRPPNSRTPLHHAAWSNDPATIKCLLDHGADPDAVDNDGASALAICAWSAPRGEDRAFDLLQQCSFRGDPPPKERQGLWYAARVCILTDNAARLETMLAQHPELFASRPETFRSLLGLAVQDNSKGVARHLLSAHMHQVVEQEQGRKFTPMHLAAQLGRTGRLRQLAEVVDRELLAEWFGQLGPDSTPLMVAARAGHADVVRCLAEISGGEGAMERGPSGSTALHEVVEGALKDAERRGREPFEDDVDAASVEVGTDHVSFPETVKALCEAYDDVDWFAVGGHERVGSANRSGGHGDQNHTAAIARAAKSNTVLRWLVDQLRDQGRMRNDDFDRTITASGSTLCHLLAQHHDHAWAAGVLDAVRYRENPQGLVADRDGHTALTVALFHGNIPVARQLLRLVDDDKQAAALARAASDVDKASGRTPLHVAAARGGLETIRDFRILEIAEVDDWQREDRFGHTPWMLTTDEVREWLIDSARADRGEEAKAFLGMRAAHSGVQFTNYPRPSESNVSWDAGLDWLPAAKHLLGGALREHALFGQPAVFDCTQVANLPFYVDQVAIAKIDGDPEVASKDLERAAYRYAIIHDGKVSALTGVGNPLNEIGKAGLRLPPDMPESEGDWQAVIQFLRFFCWFVRGDAGPFLIIDDPTPLSGFGLMPAEIRRITPLIQPVVCHKEQVRLGADSGSDATCVTARIFYSDTLFLCDLAIRRDGTVEMVWDAPLTSRLTPPDVPSLRFAGKAGTAGRRSSHGTR